MQLSKVIVLTVAYSCLLYSGLRKTNEIHVFITLVKHIEMMVVV